MRLRTAHLLLLASFALAIPRRALAWEWFRSENSAVLEGNEHLEKGQLDKAIAAYSEAAKSLPQEGGVHLDRGIALLKSKKLTEARDALLIAAQGKASPEVRAKAHYNLGLAFLEEADAASKSEDLEQAQKLLREAADAFKHSLRASPRNRDAAWNLELAKRRMVELEKKQQEKKDQQQKQQEEQKKNEDQKKSEDQQDGDESEQKDEKPQDSSGEPDAGAGDQRPDAAEPEEQGGGDAGAQPEAEQPKPEPKQPEQQKPEQQKEQQQAAPQQALPEHMQKALDALEASEENLQKHQAAMRARQQPRRIEKDW